MTTHLDRPTVLIVQDLDLAGMPYRIERAVNDFASPWRAMRVQRHSMGLGFPDGAPWTQAAELGKQADVIHFHHAYLWKNYGHLFPGKPHVVTIHGDPDTSCPFPISSEVIVTCVNPPLKKIWPEARFIPNFVIEDDLPAPRPLYSNPHKKLRVYCPPGHPMKKLNLLDEIIRRTPEVEFFHNKTRPTPNPQILKEMADCDAVWDYLAGGFSCTTIEAMALGRIPLWCGFVQGEQEHTTDQVVSALKMFARDREKAVLAASAMHDMWKTMLRAEDVIQKYIEVYNDAVM